MNGRPGNLRFPFGRFERDLEWFVAVLFEFVTIHGLNGTDGVVVVVISHEPEALSRARRQVTLGTRGEGECKIDNSVDRS